MRRERTKGISLIKEARRRGTPNLPSTWLPAVRDQPKTRGPKPVEKTKDSNEEGRKRINGPRKRCRLEKNLNPAGAQRGECSEKKSRRKNQKKHVLDKWSKTGPRDLRGKGGRQSTLMEERSRRTTASVGRKKSIRSQKEIRVPLDGCGWYEDLCERGGPLKFKRPSPRRKGRRAKSK